MRKLYFAFLNLTAIIPTQSLAADELNLENAQLLSKKIVECGKNHGHAFSIAVVNDEGNLLFFQRDPKAYSGSIKSALEKAATAAQFRRPTREFGESIAGGRMSLLSVGDLVAVEGGVPLTTSKGLPLGAVGVSGARASEDEACAVAAVKQVFQSK